MRYSERALAAGLLVVAAALLAAYEFGLVGVSLAFPVAFVLAVAGAVGLGGSKRNPNRNSHRHHR